MRATAALAAKGVGVRHIHVSTHKPLDGEALFEMLGSPKYGVVSLENHSVIGGLGSEIAEILAEKGACRKLKRMGIRDTFAHGASRAYLMREYGLDAMALVGAIESLVGQKLGIGELDLENVRIEPMHSLAKAEAL